jgi:hypothetical protein
LARAAPDRALLAAPKGNPVDRIGYWTDRRRSPEGVVTIEPDLPEGRQAPETGWLQSMKTGTSAPREMQLMNWGSSTSGVYSPRESVP